jgi:translocation and assembly module TamA
LRGVARSVIRWGAARCARTILVALLALIAAPCFAGIDIQITGVTETLENNVREFLSMTRYAARDDLTEEIVARLGRRIPTEVRRALEPLGYYSATATHTLSQTEKGWVVQIVIEPGRAVRISESQLLLIGAGANDPILQAVIKRAELHPGARLDHGVYENTKAELLRTATNNGYLDAQIQRGEMIVDAVERRASVYLTLATGEQYRFGVISVTQPVVNDDIARRLLRMRQGDRYTLDAILESQYLFDDSQYFSAVEFEPGVPDRETHEVPLDVHANKNKRNRYSISGGYGTDTNLRGKLTWDNRYLNMLGHRSQVQLTGSSVLQEASAKYIIPVMDVALEKIELNAIATQQELGDLLSRKMQLGIGLTQVLTTWQRVLFLNLSNETSETIKSEEAAAAADSTPSGKIFLIIPGVRFMTVPPSILNRDPRPYSLLAELTGSPATFGSDASFLQLHAIAERVFRIAPGWRTRLRGELGLTWADDFDELPASHRFFAGGDNSVRGFGLNELSPVANGVRIGGPYLLVGSAELERDLPKIFGIENLSAATFVDAGNAFENLQHFEIEYSVGVGLHYRLAGIASIGVDLAQALSEKGHSPRVHLSLNTLL